MLPELVLPAGSLEKLQFACAYGADAVYAGMPQFSLRARTNTFTADQLAEGIAYAHARGVRVYLTLNIFARNVRIQPSLDALRMLLPLKPDAVIMSDPGLLMLARQEFPDLALHLSTQANPLNWAAVQFWKEYGIKRVILPRELSIPEIQEIHARVPDMELEVFVHGAMCMAYSGRCLLSSYLTHREANSGVCANSCRWQYRMWEKHSEQDLRRTPLIPPVNGGSFAEVRTVSSPRLRGEKGGWGVSPAEYALEEMTRPGEFFPIDENEHGTYILNSRDLCAVEYLQDLKNAGVTGFKVEGRTKSVYYLAHIGRAYRKVIDDLRAGKPFDPAVLTDIHATATRGLTPGFLIRLPEDARQNYESAEPAYSTHKFGGVVRQYDAEKGLAAIEVKNRLNLGDTVEFVSPQEIFAQPVERMYDLALNPLTAAHGGGKNIWLATERTIEPFTILRIKEV